MKIKFKETKTPHITNIKFDLSHSKQLFKKSIPKQNPNHQNFSFHQRFHSSSFNIQQPKNNDLIKSCIFVKYNSFIPKNPNIKTVLLANDKQSKPIKSLQSAKKLQKKFPVRKILSKASTMGMFFRKQKVFEFQNPQTQLQLFKNKEITNSMVKSHSVFYSKSKYFDSDQSKQENSDRIKYKTSFQKFERYDIKNSLISNSSNLSFRKQEPSSQILRRKKISEPII